MEEVNFTFENLEGQDEVSSEASAFQREEVECNQATTTTTVINSQHQRGIKNGDQEPSKYRPYSEYRTADGALKPIGVK